MKHKLWNYIKKLNIKKWNLTYVKVAIYSIGILAVMVGVQVVINRSFQNEEKMVEAFSGAESEVVKSQLQVVGNFGAKYMTQADKEELIDFLSGKLGIALPTEKTVVEGNKTTSIATSIVGEKSKTEIESISVDYEKEKNVIETNQYVYTTIEIYDEVESILYYKDILEEAYQELGLEQADVSISFEGAYNEMLTLEEKNTITKGILDKLQGKVVRENRSDTLYTVYAYTPMVDEYISVEKERVNVNVAFSYDEETQKTMLYMASPIINMDY